MIPQGQDQWLPRAWQGEGRPAVIVIHENRGLNPHIEDVARRLAVEGYLVLAPDLLSVNGGTPPDEDKARELHAKTEREDMIAAALAAVPFMQKHAESTGKVGAVGFCFGGGIINRMAAGSPDLAAAVPEMVPAIKAALLLHYAENDENINKGIAAYEAALKANNKKFTIYIYPGTQHAFNNDTGAARYNKRRSRLEPDARVLRGEFGRAAQGGVAAGGRFFWEPASRPARLPCAGGGCLGTCR